MLKIWLEDNVFSSLFKRETQIPQVDFITPKKNFISIISIISSNWCFYQQEVIG